MLSSLVVFSITSTYTCAGLILVYSLFHKAIDSDENSFMKKALYVVPLMLGWPILLAFLLWAKFCRWVVSE